MNNPVESYYKSPMSFDVMMKARVRENCLLAADLGIDSEKVTPEELASYHYCLNKYAQLLEANKK